MKVLAQNGSPLDQAGAALVVLAFEGDTLEGRAGEIDRASQGLLTKWKAAGDLSTKPGKVSLFPAVPGVAAECLVVVGAGAADKFDAATAFRCAGAASKRLGDRPRGAVHFDFGPLADDLAMAAVAGAMNGCVGQDLFRADKSLHPFEQLVWWSSSAAVVAQAEALARAMLLTRELVNLPPNYMYPEAFARRAAEVAVASGLQLEVWDELRLRRERCNALLAVAAGSARPPRLLILRYAGQTQQAPVALVGKGVTFDSGGLSLKPTEGMLTMKCDMAGAATVLGAMQAIAAWKLPQPVVGVVGLVENMISGNCFKLGDVLTARSGKTIEIHNTDAEGRLVLADALHVALDEKPARIVDLATLTGACLVALGTDICGLMGNNADWQSAIESAAQRTGELLWRLPMHAHFADQIQSKVADIKNVGEGRWGGAITAAKFLEEFVGDTPWAHLDIAGPAFYDSAKSFMDAGGTAIMLRTLVELVRAS